MALTLMKGSEAISEAAIRAGARFFFGYPITPQTEIPEYMSARMPEVGGCFLQAESEVAAINMVYGAAGTGARVITSSSSPGVSLKQEGISYCAGAQLPCVILNVMRGGPGLILKVRPQQHQNHGRALAVAGDDERTATVVMLKIVVESRGDIVDGHTNKRCVGVAGLIKAFPGVPQAGLTVVRKKQVGGRLVCSRMQSVLSLHTLQHLGIVERREIGRTLLKARHDVFRRVDIERVNIPGDLRNLVPAFRPGIVRRRTGRAC